MRKHGKHFDLHLRTAVRERGRGDYPAYEHACLYAFRYMGMHADALTEVLKQTLSSGQMPDSSDVIIDFGCGPATSVFAFEKALGRFRPVAAYVGVEKSPAMRGLAEVALRGAGQRGFAIEETIQQAAMVFCNKTVDRLPRLFLVFSYFFGQELDVQIIREISTTVKAVIHRLRPSEVVTIYANIDIETASWMPNGDIHHWYRQFMKEMGWAPRIRKLTYKYVVPKELELNAENVSSGEVTYDVQPNLPRFADGREGHAASRHPTPAGLHIS
ncbi:MAG: hypothetical protein M5U21_02835 [Fimbriimonadaceae bacterium]|nr:hypothetical protein [Fimbriimonadaceae bacterium]